MSTRTCVFVAASCAAVRPPCVSICLNGGADAVYFFWLKVALQYALKSTTTCSRGCADAVHCLLGAAFPA
eukprot:scaffold21370_cov67-Phaeocystis_antarctica.AAC.4